MVYKVPVVFYESYELTLASLRSLLLLSSVESRSPVSARGHRRGGRNVTVRTIALTNAI